MRALLIWLLLALPVRAETVRVLLSQGAQPPVLEGRSYRGELAVQQEKGRFLLINRLDLEDYLRGVVPRELSCEAPEAMKAQAVVARTYALSHLRPGRSYDFSATERSQVYGGQAAEEARADEAVAATRGQVLMFQGQLARQVMYHSTCGGSTEDNERVFPGAPVAYLRGVACPHCGDSPYFRWTLEVPMLDLGQELERRLGKPVQPLTGLEPLERLPSGRVRRLGVTGQTAGLELRGDDMRAYLFGLTPAGQRRNLYSTRFSVETGPERLRFVGQGWGHGVGMCQWGAIGMARAGNGYREIL
ncbi:MAG: SpoIID/LytB domain-containing protein, partial [Candidatus Eremiobacterota bacterium]